MRTSCRWAAAVLFVAIGTMPACKKDSTKPHGASPSTSAPIADQGKPLSKKPKELLLGTWRYQKPTAATIARVEAKIQDPGEKAAARELLEGMAKVTKEFTQNQRITKVAGAETGKEKFEVIKQDKRTITLRLTSELAPDKPRDETYSFRDDNTMIDADEGIEHVLVRQ